MPDLPTTTKPSIFLTQEHLDIAIERMEAEGRKPPENFTKEKVQLGFRCLRSVARSHDRIDFQLFFYMAHICACLP